MSDDDIREITPGDFDNNEDDQWYPNTSKDPLDPHHQRMEHIPMGGMGYVNLDKLEANSARLKMLEHVYQTPPERLSELTYLGRHETANLAFMMMFDELASPTHVPGSAFTVWRNYFFALRRSVGGRHLGKGYQLAEAGMLTDDKGIGGMALELE